MAQINSAVKKLAESVGNTMEEMYVYCYYYYD